MRALGYKSVSTVAIHVNGLIERGWLRKKDHSARSLEVVSLSPSLPRQPENPHMQWLKAEIKKREKNATPVDLEHVKVLQRALVILDNSDKQDHIKS